MYLESFSLPVSEESSLIERRMWENGGIHGYIDNSYPCGLFGPKQLYEICFRNITILYGGNGSGKSTLLNLIAARLKLNRIAPFNSGELFDAYAEKCSYTMDRDDEGFLQRIPNGSRIITSDDIFDYMLTVRTNNDEIEAEIERGKTEYQRLKYGDTVKFSGMEDYEALRMQVQARSRSVSRRRFIRRTVGTEVKLNSNGETALNYFEAKLKNDTLYCLDEPENSMSPKMQLELTAILEKMTRFCGCQFIIATHSPFLLSMDGARIYDLDASPVDVKNWWELENTRIYYDFFEQHKDLFRQHSGGRRF